MMGCFRSGTNFAKSLLESNYECKIKNHVFGWKHGFLPIMSEDSNAEYKFIFDTAFFITKNPFSLLVSLFNYHNEVQRNLIAPNVFSDFLRSKLIVHDQAQANSVQLRFSSPVDYWNAMNWNYASHKDFVHVRYESLVEYPEVITKKLADKLDLSPKEAAFFVPEKKVKRTNDNDKLTSKEDYMTEQNFDRSAYMKNQYMKNFSAEDIALVASELDRELIEKLGYTPLMQELYKDY
ncbi:hypothetical protein BFC18_13025 [Alteromonas confluentis]|uniref:Sulfotransferase domain-containing protein n=2 Tax=Alteromonas confluentis TaxID=1656094 RepID=A0A1E7Z9B2_9ALTE|nr:hypothetical protein BFC18_13025 [Alteromonas confluentis]